MSDRPSSSPTPNVPETPSLESAEFAAAASGATVDPVQSAASGTPSFNIATADTADLDWYRALSRHIPALCFVLELDGAIQSASQVGLDTLGYQLDEVMGRSLYQFLTLSDQAAFQAAYAALLQDPQMQLATSPFPWNGWLERRDRPPLWVSVSAQVVQANERTGVVLVCHPTPPVEPPAEPPASQRDRWLEPAQSDSKTQLQLLTDFHADGSLRWVWSRGFSIKDESGQIYRYAGIAEDVTQRKQSQEQLETRQIQLTTAQQVAQIGSWEFNIATQAIAWSDQNFRLYGLNPALSEPSYPDLLQKFVPADRERLAIACSTAIATGEPYELDLLLLPLPGGSERHLNIRGEAIRDAQGRVVRLVGTTQDITERKHLETQLNLQAQRQAILHQVIQAIRNSLDLATIFETAVRETGRLLGISRVTLVQYLPQCTSWVVQAEYRHTPDIVSRLGQEIPDYDNPLADMLRRGEIVRLDDNRTAAGAFNQQLAQAFPGRWLLVPLRIGALTWGSLTLTQTQGSGGSWQDWEVELVTTLADQLAIAIQQSELYQQLTQLNTQLESTVHLRTRQLQRALDLEASLKHITDQVRDSLDENQILQTAVEQLGMALGVECCDAGLYDFSTETVTICHEYVRTERQPSAQGTLLPLFALPNVRSQLLQRQHVQFCCIGPVVDSYYLNKLHQTILACPMMDDHGVLGDIWLFKPQGQEFDDLEIRLVHQVANQCAIALRQSHLYQKAQEQVKELERLNYLKDDFLSTVSHELRSPMASIKMATEMLEIILQDDTSMVDEQNRALQYFKILHDECDRETALINDLLDLSRLDAQADPLLLNTLAFQPWLLHVAEPFIKRAQHQHQSLEFDLPPDLVPFTTDFTYLERILTELLHNACKYTAPGERVIVTMRVIKNGYEDRQKTENEVEVAFKLQISITNTGIEISPEEYDRVFEKFYRIPNNDPWKHGGTGLGLALVKRRVAHLNGTIHVSSSNRQTTFTVLL